MIIPPTEVLIDPCGLKALAGDLEVVNSDRYWTRSDTDVQLRRCSSWHPGPAHQDRVWIDAFWIGELPNGTHHSRQTFPPRTRSTSCSGDTRVIPARYDRPGSMRPLPGSGPGSPPIRPTPQRWWPR